MSGKRFLVTGGAGFIGSHLVDSLLRDGHAVRVLDDLSTGRRENLDPRAELVLGDVADAACVVDAMTGIDGVYHLAAIASVARGNEDWSGTHRVNQSGTIAVLDAARRAKAGTQGRKVPVVYASSAAIYGDTGAVVAHEDLTPCPSNAYGVDKLGSEMHARVGSRLHGVPTLGLRFFNVYGPRQDPSSPYSGVISIFVRRLTDDLPIVLHGDGGQTRDFVHVADVVAHLRAAMRRLGGQTAPGEGGPSPLGSAVNVCTGRSVTIADLARRLGELRGAAAALQHGPARAGDIRHSCGNPARAIALLDVRAKVRLEDGLAALSTEEFGWNAGVAEPVPDTMLRTKQAG